MNRAGMGTDHLGYGACKYHLGCTRSLRIAAYKQIAREMVVTLGLARDIDPRDALLEEVHRTAGVIAWVEDRIRLLEEKDVTWGVTKVKTSDESGNEIIESADLNAWVRLYHIERAHLVKVCDVCIRVGIEDRKVRLAEEQGAMIAEAIGGILDDLNLTAAQLELVSQVVPSRLRALAIESAPA